MGRAKTGVKRRGGGIMGKDEEEGSGETLKGSVRSREDHLG